MTVTVELTNDQCEMITRESEKAFPRECCGLLIGTGDDPVTVTDVVIAENVAESPSRFLVDPQCQFDWMRKLRGTSDRIVGLYHSHPNGRCDPSAYDAEMAIEPEQIWLIVPLCNGQAEEIKGFWSRGLDKGFDTLSLSITESP